MLRSLERVAYFYWMIGHPFGLLLREEYERWLRRLIEFGALEVGGDKSDQLDGHIDWKRTPSIRPRHNELMLLPTDDDWSRVAQYVRKHIDRDARDQIVLQHGFLRNVSKAGGGKGPYREDRIYVGRRDARELTNAQAAMLDYELALAGDSVIGIDTARKAQEVKEEAI